MVYVAIHCQIKPRTILLWQQISINVLTVGDDWCLCIVSVLNVMLIQNGTAGIRDSRLQEHVYRYYSHAWKDVKTPLFFS